MKKKTVITFSLFPYVMLIEKYSFIIFIY